MSTAATQQKQYDNSGGLWIERRAWSGTATIDGDKYQAVCVATNAEGDKLPSHRLHLYRGSDVYSAALWRPKEAKKYKASGHVHIGDRQWLVFVFECDSSHAKAPVFRLSFLEKDGQSGAAQGATGRHQSNSDTPVNDEVPF